ncbi:MAG: heavy-metal-associated domain-containing protein [Bdellovibrionales bacterium]
MQKWMIAIVLMLFNQMAFAKQAKVHVNGMVCAFCSQGITKGFKEFPEVEKVDVSMESKIITVALKEGQQLSDNQISEVITKAGVTVDKIVWQ